MVVSMRVNMPKIQGIGFINNYLGRINKTLKLVVGSKEKNQVIYMLSVYGPRNMMIQLTLKGKFVMVDVKLYLALTFYIKNIS